MATSDATLEKNTGVAPPPNHAANTGRHPNEIAETLREHIRNLERALEKKEEQLKKTHAQLAHADKLATLGTMGAGMAHELNNPLTVISAEADEILDALHDGYGDTESTLVSARNIKDCAERMRRIIDHIRQYARKDDDAPWQRLDINTPIRDSLIILKPQLENSGIEVTLSLAENLPKIWGHPNRLESVFQNLIANARDAFNNVGDDRMRHLTVSSKSENDRRIVVVVADNACGMSDQVRERIFDPFYTTKQVGSGTGLGLAITLEHIREHRGTLVLDTEVNKGTKFTLRFPLERREIVRNGNTEAHNRV